MNVTEVHAGADCRSAYSKALLSGWCRCLKETDNVHTNLAAQLRRQKSVTRILEPNDGFTVGSGGLAVLLRGGAFRGSPLDDAAARQRAQLVASQTVFDKAIKPFVALNQRVRIFLTLYSDVNASQIRALYAPYAPHVAAVTRLHEGASEQITMAANAIGAFLQVCKSTADHFDAVVLTRFDLAFKMDFTRLLGTRELSQFYGVKLLWRELEAGNKWRLLWKPSQAELDRLPTDKDRERLLHAAWKREHDRNYTFHREQWRKSWRSADTIHAFSFSFSHCFRFAVLFEMTRGWVPTQKSPGQLSTIDWEGKARAHARANVTNPRFVDGTPPPSTPEHDTAMVEGVDYMTTIVGAADDDSFWRGTAHATKPYSEAHLTHFVTNHWLHKTKYHLLPYLLRVGSRLGYLVEDGSFDSNPCSANCLLNPVYDILPRHGWLRESQICQDPSDFVFDPVSETLCCPSPDYCCPHSHVDCAAPGAILFDAANVPEKTIAYGWRQHYLGGMPTLARDAPIRGELSSAVCPAKEWNGGLAGTSGCSILAMTDSSVEKVRRIWKQAPPWRGPHGETMPIDDDNVG